MREFNILAVIPTYNEAKNILNLLDKILDKDTKFSVLVVDDNSPDNTSLKVKKIMAKYPNLNLIKRSPRLGLGSAYIKGFNYAIEKGFDLVVQMDADLSHDPAYISKMLELINNYDLVIGSRYIRGGSIEDWSRYRLFLSKLANSFSKFMLGIPVCDLTSGFKIVKTSALEDIDFKTIASRGYAFQIEMVYRVFLKNCRITEYPIIFKGRKHNKSKMTLGIAIEAFFRVMWWGLVRFCRFLSRRFVRKRK